MDANLEFSLDLIGRTRGRMLKLLEGMPRESLFQVPAGFRNNLLWNLGHAVVSQQLLCYEKSGQTLRIPAYYLPLFRKGTSPSEWTGQIDAEEVKTWAMETPKMLREDVEQGRFGNFTPYETSFGVRLANLPDVLAFAAFHEAQHFGIMTALRKLTRIP